jgi:hypothetical protein
VSTDADYDEYKRIWLETDPWLFGITCLVTVLHTVFELLAFKSDVNFWKGKEDIKGISLKGLWIELAEYVIILLYFWDNETSLLIWFPHALAIVF